MVGGIERKGRRQTEIAWKVTTEEVKARGYNLDFKNPHTIAEDHGDPAELLRKLEESEEQANSLTSLSIPSQECRCSRWVTSRMGV